jgi:murein DD-endopeptidase MepM/ murein hydrolase activator NlpD
MRNVPSVFGTRRVVRFALAGMTAGLLAGCADSRSILGDPLGNPFKSASTDPTPTGSYDPAMTPPPYTPRRSVVMSQPLSPPPAMPARNMATYDAPAHQSPHLAPSYATAPTDRTASIASGRGGWSAANGMAIVAASGETASILGDRYNVPTDVLLRINGFKSASQIHAGTRVVIPVYSASVATETKKSAKLTVLHKPNDRTPKERLLVKHDVKGKLVVTHETPKHDVMHWAKGPVPVKKANLVVEKPTHKVTKVAAAEETAPTSAPPAKAHAVDPTPTASLPGETEQKVATSSGNPEFRWPAHGRIIQGFKSGGNDGINIAVPEGTSVKAAESGVVAYAGSEIKGFGNLVLIRHPNGYVTAYANNGSLDVHRGEQVKRGQTIAKSGQSGNVASPQLHFELRKGSTPVDPTHFLAGL